MRYALPKMSERAQALYRDNAPIRSRDQIRNEVLNGRHVIDVPESLAERIFNFKSNILATKRRVAKTFLMDDDGPRYSVSDFGSGVKAEHDRTNVEEWSQGMSSTRRGLFPTMEQEVVDDLLVHGVTAIMVLPYGQEWGDAKQVDLTDIDTLDIDEIDRRISDTLQYNAKYKTAKPPIWWKHVQAESLILRPDMRGGWAEAWIFEEVPVLDVLDLYRKKNGDVAAEQLAESISPGLMTSRNVCTVVTYLDKQDIQIALLNISIEDTDGGTSWRTTTNNVEEMLYEATHGMGCLPLAVGYGDVWATRDPTLRFRGFFDSAINATALLDNMITQASSVVRDAAWTGGVIEHDAAQPLPQAPGVGDSPRDIVLTEGAWNDPLGPGESLAPVRQMDPSAWQWLKELMTYVQALIDQHTLPPAANNVSGAGSGYQLALEQSSIERPLLAYQWGLQDLWRQVAVLQLKAACYLMQPQGSAKDQFDPIPVRFVNDDGARPVTLTYEQAEMDWEIKTEVRIRQVGGEAALIQTLVAAESAGYLDHFSAMRRFGVQNPTRTWERVQSQQHANTPEIFQALNQLIMQDIYAAVQQSAEEQMAGTPMLPASLAASLQTPGAQARLPMGGTPSVGIGSQGAMPNMAAGNMAPPAPTLNGAQMAQAAARMPNAATQPGSIGGNPAGQALALPGGLDRMSQAMGR